MAEVAELQNRTDAILVEVRAARAECQGNIAEIDGMIAVIDKLLNTTAAHTVEVQPF